LRLAVAALFCELAAGGTDAGDPLGERLKVCGTCHGETGNAKMEKTPSLAGQPALFLTNQLILMRDKVRKSEVMEPFVKGLSDAEIIAIAEHYAKLRPEPSTEPVDAALAARGAELARKLYCRSCHLPDYAGRAQIPRLARQRLDYLIDSLTAYRDGRRSGIDSSMNAVMYQVSNADIATLAHYLASRR
jgi:cytochrome c553